MSSVAYFITAPPRVGRSQGASLFWGLISVCFAAAACFYYWKNHENETTADVMRDQVLQLREENESLNSQKEHLQASKIEAENQIKTREDLIQEKETQLAGEELRLDGLGHQTAAQSAQNLGQVAMIKKFNDVIRKLGKDTPPDVVERAGRPVLRVPNAQLFAPGDSVLKPEGAAELAQISQAISGQMDTFELRVVSYTDTDAEAQAVAGAKKDPADPQQAHSASWSLTAARATALARYFREQSPLPFLNVIVSGRGDSEPISSNSGSNHARNCRVEISVTPQPVPFHPPDADKTVPPATATTTPAATTSPAPATDTPPAPAKKDKPKDKKPDKTPSH